MADQVFNVNCGFFDSVNNDRLYTADQMNRPYKRLVSNGVFATPQGTPSTDLQVISAGNGMAIVVQTGAGIFADKWFENPSGIQIAVPANSGIVPRFDSVIVQVDKRESGRVGNIVYRTGTAATNPQPPAINTVENVVEYRLANVYVASGAQNINNDAITDCRGSSDCPWITSLIYQVDTSTLFNQWQAAYQSYYSESTQSFEEFTEEQREAWEQFLQNLTDDLTVATNVIMLTSNYVAPSTVSNVPIQIPSYDPDTDILMVYVNGLRVAEGVQYTLAANKTSINLKSNVTAGQTVMFTVFKSIIAADLQTTVTAIQQLNTRISQITADSGWINFTLESGASAYDSNNKPGVRCIGDRVYLRGAFKGVTTLGSTICTLPVSMRPAQAHTFTTASVSGTTVGRTVVMQVQPGGSIKLLAASGSLTSSHMISIATDFPLN